MRLLLLVPALLLAPLAGCASDDPPMVDEEAIAAEAARSAEEATQSIDIDGATVGREAPGSLVDVVTTEDGAIELGVTDEVLFTRLSAATQREVAEEMEAETADEEGLGGTIARAVTGAVAEGLATTVSVPLADVVDVRYEDGRVVIEMADGERAPFANAKTNDEPLLDQFDAVAGQRLAEAFDKATSR